ncbi:MULTISPECIES: NAD(P)H-dependent oxidoreductase [unclassified Myroides]|uniref:NAD(P)H-dependent oxidoreductase n=1 Tax=unclassified Myroides TaxID=2642485 RepID=UPI003100C2F5
MTLIDNLKWRYAAKAYDPTKKVSEENLQKILDAITLAPSSSGLQPFRILVIENQDIKNELVPYTLNPECVRDCSHVIVFAAWDKYSDEKIDNVYNLMTDIKGLPRGRFDSYTDQLKQSFKDISEEANFDHTARQTYIALGIALAQAAELRIDSTPAEGFNNEMIDKVLGLREKGLKSTLMMYIGYRDEANDWNVSLKKSRIPQEELITRL